MDTHRETEKEKSDAIRWIFGAGVGALALSFFAYSVDQYMVSARQRDIAHGAMMKELRVAQTSLPSRVTDDRQKSRIPPVEKVAALEESESAVHGHGHDDHDH